MGREIRRVIPNWEHPKYTAENAVRRPRGDSTGEYRPLYDRSFREAMAEWWEEYQRWEAGERPESAKGFDGEFWEWDGPPPDPEYHRPHWPEGTATWWQAYETVSEGTPISPPFPTDKALIEWLSTHADFWGQGPRTKESAERFVRGGWAPSMVMTGGRMLMNTDALDALHEDGP